MNNPIKFIAFYLPQFHPIPENDQWWGKGFTEWTNVVKAKPLFRGHYQPRLPADLSFYDLRVPEVREAQAEMARSNGIYGFCYYHYWFGNGKRILERPFNEVLESGKPDLPFCLCWANETWEGRWYGITNNSGSTLIKQEYPGEKDYEAHFNSLLKAFTDHRYILVEGKPLFQIFCPHLLPDATMFAAKFRELAIKNGLPGMYLVGGQKTPVSWNPLENGFDAVISGSFGKALTTGRNGRDKLVDFLWENKVAYKLFSKGKSLNKITVYDYKKILEIMKGVHTEDTKKQYPVFPVVVNDWDNTARAGRKGIIFRNASPALYKQHLTDAVASLQNKEDDRKIIFIKSWNEWAEGNYLEPDTKSGMKYLHVIRDIINNEPGSI